MLSCMCEACRPGKISGWKATTTARRMKATPTRRSSSSPRLHSAQERQLAREFSREYHLITREDRLDKVGEDLVQHFVGRGFMGKAMVVLIDEATAVRMYDKVRARWNAYIEDLGASLPTAEEDERVRLHEMIDYMMATDMAMVVSQAQNEVTDMAEKGLDIVWHRQRMIHKDLETKFKDPDDPFRIVFVCSMWMTRFDVPSCSTIYLDKPMRNHSLMQTIARANRVWRDKTNGLIVDYVGVFRDLQRALGHLRVGAGGAAKPGELPIMPKSELIEALRAELEQATAFCMDHGVSIEGMLGVKAFEYVKLRDDTAGGTIHGTAVSGGARGGGAGNEATPVMGGGRKALGGLSGSQPIRFANTFYSSFAVLDLRVVSQFDWSRGLTPQ